jgi:hypothetical protein
MADRDQNWYKIRNIWYGMIHRTTNPEHTEYFRYGGRGIQVCDKWHSFDCFYQDMKDGYFPGLSIDRIDNSLGYNPENCRWATKKDQANNRRSSKFFTIDGVTKTLSEWIEQSGIKSSTVRQRLYCYGWSIERALSNKVGGQIG